MNIERFTNRWADATDNVQTNLKGKSYYFEPDTMRAFKSRVLSCHITDEGLLLGVVESFANYEGKRRFRHVIFNVVGNVVSRSEHYTNKARALRSMWEAVNGMDAKEITREALASHLRSTSDDVNRLLASLDA